MTFPKKIFFYFIIIPAMISCGSTRESSDSAQKESQKQEENTKGPSLEYDYEKNNFVKGTVIDQSDLAGCTFVITLEGGEKIQPINLEPEFAKHNLPVWVKYKKKNTPSTCMVGDVAIIGAIELRDN